MESNQLNINSTDQIIKPIIIIGTQTVTIIDTKIVKKLRFDENTYFQQQITDDDCILLKPIKTMTFIFTDKKFKQEIELLSISDAVQLNFGRIKVQGIITSISKLYKLVSKVKLYCDKCQFLTEEEFDVPISNISDTAKKCIKCNKYVKNVADYDYVNAINLELQDTNSFNDINRLSVVLLNEDTKKISVGEKVHVIGNIHIINNIRKEEINYFHVCLLNP